MCQPNADWKVASEVRERPSTSREMPAASFRLRWRTKAGVHRDHVLKRTWLRWIFPGSRIQTLRDHSNRLALVRIRYHRIAGPDGVGNGAMRDHQVSG